MSKEERRREREEEEQRKAEVEEAVKKMRFVEGRGVDVHVDRDGRASGFVPGKDPVEGTGGWDDDVTGAPLDDLNQMHKSERERSIILEAWKRFQNGDGSVSRK
jgi:hypothetical protein